MHKWRGGGKNGLRSKRGIGLALRSPGSRKKSPFGGKSSLHSTFDRGKEGYGGEGSARHGELF